jgi:hypothetical protein
MAKVYQMGNQKPFFKGQTIKYICWPLYCLSFELRFWLPLWYLLAIVLSVLWTSASDYLFGICWPLYCMSFELRLLITSLISVVRSRNSKERHYNGQQIWKGYILWPLYYLSFELRLLITHLKYFGHCIACPLNYGFWLPIWNTLAIVLPVLWIQWPKYIKEVTRSRNSKDRQYNGKSISNG